MEINGSKTVLVAFIEWLEQNLLYALRIYSYPYKNYFIIFRSKIRANANKILNKSFICVVSPKAFNRFSNNKKNHVIDELLRKILSLKNILRLKQNSVIPLQN